MRSFVSSIIWMNTKKYFYHSVLWFLCRFCFLVLCFLYKLCRSFLKHERVFSIFRHLTMKCQQKKKSDRWHPILFAFNLSSKAAKATQKKELRSERRNNEMHIKWPLHFKDDRFNVTDSAHRSNRMSSPTKISTNPLGQGRATPSTGAELDTQAEKDCPVLQ